MALKQNKSTRVTWLAYLLSSFKCYVQQHCLLQTKLKTYKLFLIVFNSFSPIIVAELLISDCVGYQLLMLTRQQQRSGEADTARSLFPLSIS